MIVLLLPFYHNCPLIFSGTVCAMLLTEAKFEKKKEVTRPPIQTFPKLNHGCVPLVAMSVKTSVKRWCKIVRFRADIRPVI